MTNHVRTAAGAALFVLAACGGPRPTTEVAQPDDDTAEALELADTYMMHGVEVEDRYRWLESEAPATWRWVDDRNAEADAWFAEHADAHRSERLAELLGIGSISGAARAAGMTFVQKREGDAEQPILYVLGPDGAPPRVLVDPNTLGERVALDWFEPSPGGEYLAYGLSSNGDERSTLHVLHVATGATLEDTIPHTKWVSLDWQHDEAGFFYTRYPMVGEPDYDADAEDTYHRHLFHHRLGDDADDDRLVMRAPEPTDFLGGEVSEDGATLVIGVFRGWSSSDVYLLDLTTPDAEPAPVVVGEDAIWWGTFHRDHLYVQTNADAPRGRILRAEIASAADPETWTEIVPEQAGKLEGFVIADDRLVAHYVENVSSVLRSFALDGAPAGSIELPMEIGTASSLAAEAGDDTVVFQFTSFFHPPSLYEHDLTAGETSLIDRVAADIDTSAFTVERAVVASADGTPINVFVARRRDMPLDGNRPVLLSGYGGFDVSLTPTFARNAIYWLERGGTYAVANIRGGGEFGEEWHRAGMLGNKENVFDDFEAVIRWFGGESGISNPDRIAITGGSNGGLLMGAMLTRCPDAFRATVSNVGLYDMVRYSLYPPAEIWIPEYGDPDDPEHFAWLHAYSPYHHIEAGTPYPAALIMTADSDTRVSWRHSTKFAAALRDATSSDRPILFTMKRGMGHGAGTGLSDLVDEYVQRYTFIETELGVTQ